MDISQINPTILVASLIVTSTPLVLAALGELVAEKSGVLNLGVEGMMIMGAVCGFIIGVETGSALLGIIASAFGGAFLSLLFAFVVLVMKANQVASGLALTIFGLGVAALLGHPYTGIAPPKFESISLPIIENIPVLGVIFFQHDFIVYFSIIACISTWYFLKYSKRGLILRSIGEDHEVAHSLGYNVIRTRFFSIVFGGAFAGLGGGYLSLVRVPQWTEGMTAGAGWIALALVVFSGWHPLRLILGAYIFGGITILQLNLQAIGININIAVLSMAPYLATILALVIISTSRFRGNKGSPGCLGKSFVKIT
jgi:simple sugar transport system permease protein